MRRREMAETVYSAEGYYVAVYGSLRKGLALHHVIENCRFLGKGIVSGADMYSFDAYPAIVLRDDMTRKIVVELYSVPLNILRRLDGIEGAYDRDIVTVELDNGLRQQSLIYTMTDKDVGGFFFRNADEVESGDWTQFKLNLDAMRVETGLHIDSWGTV